MKPKAYIPLERLLWFQKKLSLGPQEEEKLRQYRSIFADEKDVFAEHFYQYFFDIPETRPILDHEERREHLKEAWSRWFDSLFKEDFSEPFLRYLWRSGLRHVEVNIDKRYINLGYSIVRRFCQDIVRAKVPPKDQESVLVAIDKMIDFCLLIETHAYVAATSQCDMEIVRGISHQVRNPLTVIGGNILRLKKGLEPQSSLHKTYETILDENKRLERMVIDAAAYSEMFERPPEFTQVLLEEVLAGATERLVSTHPMEQIEIEFKLDQGSPSVNGVAEDLETMFYYLLENSVEAVDPANPYIRVTSKLLEATPSFIEIRIFNNGNPPRREEIDNLFVPFYSTKPYGTGFGLPIAHLAARKNLGDLVLEPVPEKGTSVVIKLPVPP